MKFLTKLIFFDTALKNILNFHGKDNNIFKIKFKKKNKYMHQKQNKM